MSARDELLREMTHNHLYMTDERANELLDAFAHELAEQQRGLTVYELDWAPGNHQWQCPRCGTVGNVTPTMASTPGPWHRCRVADASAGPVRPGEEPTT